ncbi:MAG TPA: DUF5131 family protein [Dehalococcoidales bacterium]
MTLDSQITNKREITSGTKEWADHNVNCVKGCSNNCRYCYAKMMAKRFGRCTETTWKDMAVNDKTVKTHYGKYKGRVMFPSSHDIIDTPIVLEACFTVLSKLLKAGNETLITTKPGLSVVKKITHRFQRYDAQIQFRFTITSMNDKLLSFWEPNAPKFHERLDSLKYAFDKGFKTSVSIEPFLDYEPQKLVFTVAPFVTESIWLGPMNYIPNNDSLNGVRQRYVMIRKNYETAHLQEIYEDLIDFPLIQFKDSMLNRLGIKR